MSHAVVWFKRDLRVQDHAPLRQASAQGALLRLYVLERGLWSQPDHALQHYRFLQESLRDLAGQLRPLGATRQLAAGELPEVLARLHAVQPFHTLLSHEETGNGHTYARDLAVARWCRDQGVTWRKWAPHGVVRRLRSRDPWSQRWEAHMAASCQPAPWTGGRAHRLADGGCLRGHAA